MSISLVRLRVKPPTWLGIGQIVAHMPSPLSLLLVGGLFLGLPADAQTGTVLMTHNTGSNNWTVYDPSGIVITPHNYADCQGLHEAAAFATNNGMRLVVQGGGVITSTNTDYTRIHCTSTLQLGPFQGQDIEVNGVTLILDPQSSSADGMTIDTVDFTRLKIQGQIVYTGTGFAVHLYPTHTNGEIDNTFIGATSSFFAT